MSARARAARLLALPRTTAAPRRPALERAPPPPLTRCTHANALSDCALMRLIRCLGGDGGGGLGGLGDLGGLGGLSAQ